MNNLEKAAIAMQEQQNKQKTHISAQTTAASNAAAANNSIDASITKRNLARIMADKMKMDLMEMIRMERKNQHLTQRQLAEKANSSQGTITRLERHGFVSLWTLITIVAALGKKLTIHPTIPQSNQITNPKT